MKIVEPSYEILHCRDGEEILAFLERVCRTAYKSEDKIDDGWRSKSCEACDGKGYTGFGPSPETHCQKCGGGGHTQFREEPSSHKLIRRILKTDRREQLIAKVRKACHIPEGIRALQGPEVIKMIELAVNVTMDELRDDPPHESVIEHESITVLFTSNRGFTHELVRHRLAAFTQESTRYCNYSKGKFGEEIALCPERKLEGEDPSASLEAWYASLGEAERFYMILIEDGVKPQIARDLLPQVLKADIVITANLREWRHIFKMRCSPKAHPDMRRLMIPLRDELRQRIPIIFDEV